MYGKLFEVGMASCVETGSAVFLMASYVDARNNSNLPQQPMQQT